MWNKITLIFITLPQNKKDKNGKIIRTVRYVCKYGRTKIRQTYENDERENILKKKSKSMPTNPLFYFD